MKNSTKCSMNRVKQAGVDAATDRPLNRKVEGGSQKTASWHNTVLLVDCRAVG
jgi:hypothetical protein